MSEERKNILCDLPTDLVNALDEEAESQKRSRRAQLEIILEDRYRPSISTSPEIAKGRNGRTGSRASAGTR